MMKYIGLRDISAVTGYKKDAIGKFIAVSTAGQGLPAQKARIEGPTQWGYAGFEVEAVIVFLRQRIANFGDHMAAALRARAVPGRVMEDF